MIRGFLSVEPAVVDGADYGSRAFRIYLIDGIADLLVFQLPVPRLYAALPGLCCHSLNAKKLHHSILQVLVYVQAICCMQYRPYANKPNIFYIFPCFCYLTDAGTVVPYPLRQIQNQLIAATAARDTWTVPMPACIPLCIPT